MTLQILLRELFIFRACLINCFQRQITHNVTMNGTIFWCKLNNNTHMPSQIIFINYMCLSCLRSQDNMLTGSLTLSQGSELI